MFGSKPPQEISAYSLVMVDTCTVKVYVITQLQYLRKE